MHQLLLAISMTSGGVDICLVTSGRRALDHSQGNPIRPRPHRLRPGKLLEAGLVGRVSKRCIGTFKFDRIGTAATPPAGRVYALRVERQMRIWTEMHEDQCFAAM
jgi:hypothetical protein